MESLLKIKIKTTSGGKVYEVDIHNDNTILELKNEVAKHCKYPAEEQTLIHKGKILNNEKKVSDYKIENENVLILVKSKSTANLKKQDNQPNTNQENTSANNNTNNNTNNTNTNTGNNKTTENTNNTNNNNTNDQNNQDNPFAGIGDLNLNPSDMQGIMNQMNGGLGINMEALGGMMSNPMVQNMMTSLMNNPQLMSSLLQNSPLMQNEAMRNSPIGQMLNNPETLRSIMTPENIQASMNLMRNMYGNNNNNNSNNTNNNGTSNNDTNNMNNLMQQMMSQMMNNNMGGGAFGNLNNQGGLGNLGDLSQLFAQMQGINSPLQYNAGQNTNNNSNNNSQQNSENKPEENVDYREKYKEQLAQMKDMGFTDEETNINMLKQCQGNVQFAVERMLNMLG